jgi:Ca2+-binding RTX toxin-like protein
VARILLSHTTFRSIGYGDWAINLDGGGSQDDVTAALGRRASGVTNLTARLGEGTDFFTGGITGNTDDGRTRMKVYGSYGADVLTGGVAPDVLDGGGGNDIIRGGAGDDRLNGGSERDELYGDAGRDYLDGGPGIDTFRQYRGGGLFGLGFSQDRIVDREPGEVIDDGTTAWAP